MPSAEAFRLTDEERRALLAVARRSLVAAVGQGAVAVDFAHLPRRLAEPGASFVTLEAGGQLRGCIGSLERRAPLAEDVAANAAAAALRDPRFPPVEAQELPGIAIHLSVLSPLEPLAAASEEELVEKLRPGVDGLVVEAGWRRATFLPAVWRQLPEPRDFLAHLYRKAGIATGTWSEGFRFSRYTVEEFS